MICSTSIFFRAKALFIEKLLNPGLKARVVQFVLILDFSPDSKNSNNFFTTSWLLNCLFAN